MSEILHIINENLGPENFNEKSFTGNVFFQHENGLNMERSIYNRLLNKYNVAFDLEEGDVLTINDDLLLVFVNEIFEDNSGSLFRMDRNYYLSAIILDWGILSIWSEETEGSDKKPDGVFALPWKDIDYVELFENTEGGFIFRFYEKNKAEHSDLLSNRFGTSSLVASNKILNIFNEIIEYKKNITDQADDEYFQLKSKIAQFSNEEKYKEALVELENFGDLYNINDFTLDCTQFYYWWKTQSLLDLKETEEALATIEYYIKKCEEIRDFWAYSYALKGKTLLEKKDYFSATNFLAYSEEKFEEEDQKRISRNLKEESYSKLKNVFLEIPFSQRKLIFIGEDICSTKSGTMVILKNNDLPLNINFPIGHPHLNEVYTCHPHKRNFYLPLKDYSEELFMDRINEFSYLLQCLGATKLEISSSKSNSSDQRTFSKNDIDAKIDYKINSAKVDYKGETTENTLIDGKLKIAKKQIFKPTKAPYIPPNLVWYYSDLNWQRLVDQRLNGSIMTHSEVISSSQSENISSHELKQVDAELRLLLPKIGVSYNSENEISTSSLKTHDWLVSVEFEDVDKLLLLENKSESTKLQRINTNLDEYTSNLERYKEDVLLMIEDDGVIDEMERNILNRKIKKYGLSEEDAKAIENDLATSHYSENELKYIHELKDFLEDGTINELERKILDRYALKFGLEKSKQLEIDNIFINP